MTRADLDKRPGDVAAMFDAIAGRYDLLNDILSAGQVRLWRRAVARITAPGRASGCSTWPPAPGLSLAFTATGADCVACDFSLGMLGGPSAARGGPRVGSGERGRALRPRETTADTERACGVRQGVPGGGAPPEGSRAVPPGRLSFAAGDALRLPFRDEAFDAVTISFGLRNVADPGQALAEMRRVTRPGRAPGGVRVQHDHHCPGRYAVPALPDQSPARDRPAGRPAARKPTNTWSSRSPDWPAQPELAGLIETAGWSAVRWRDLSLGAVAVHVGRRT